MQLASCCLWRVSPLLWPGPRQWTRLLLLPRPACQQQHLTFISEFTCDICYLSGDANSVADAWYRSPLRSPAWTFCHFWTLLTSPLPWWSALPQRLCLETWNFGLCSLPLLCSTSMGTYHLLLPPSFCHPASTLFIPSLSLLPTHSRTSPPRSALLPSPCVFQVSGSWPCWPQSAEVPSSRP